MAVFQQAMAIIVQHKDGNRYILLGFGYGLFKATRPDVFFGNLLPNEQSGERSLLSVCDQSGMIGVVKPEDCIVVDVDGCSPDQIL